MKVFGVVLAIFFLPAFAQAETFVNYVSSYTGGVRTEAREQATGSSSAVVEVRTTMGNAGSKTEVIVEHDGEVIKKTSVEPLSPATVSTHIGASVGSTTTPKTNPISLSTKIVGSISSWFSSFLRIFVW